MGIIKTQVSRTSSCIVLMGIGVLVHAIFYLCVYVIIGQSHVNYTINNAVKRVSYSTMP